MREIAIAFSLLFFISLQSSISQGSDTSENTEVLKKIFERFPDADLNKDGVLTRIEAQTFNRERKKSLDSNPANPDRRAKAPRPTHADVSYGDHDLQVFDLWIAEPKEGGPTPLAIYIHGGGFRGGDKGTSSGKPVQQFLDAGISYASMNYRLTDSGPYPMQHQDCARALQFIRHHAKKWNLNPDRFACYGGSAGAGISLWLAFHDDLADPESDDPVARHSTKLVAAATINGQSTYDLRTFREIFEFPELKMHEALYPFYAVKEDDEFDTERVRNLMADASAITHVDKDDSAPVFALYGSRGPGKINADTNPSAWVHHMKLGLYLKEEMDKLGLECHVTYARNPAGGFSDITDFLIKKLSNGE